jgi:hypothetical protein
MHRPDPAGGFTARVGMQGAMKPEVEGAAGIPFEYREDSVAAAGGLDLRLRVEGGLFARVARRMLQFPPCPRLVETASDKAWRRETLPGLLTAPQAAGQ